MKTIIFAEKKEASVMDSSPREHRPMLTHGPRDAYVVRNRPATLTCRALNSRKIRFKCNGQWVTFFIFYLLFEL